MRPRQAPPCPTACAVYASDGGARNQGAADAQQSSCGCVRYREGTREVHATCGVFLGDVTNNVSKYEGVILAFTHALSNPAPCLRFHVDSLLVARQLNLTWRCLSPDLRPLYMRALGLVRRLRSTRGVGSVEIQHIYREFNADADGICNSVLDIAAAGRAPREHETIVALNWEPFVAPAPR